MKKKQIIAVLILGVLILTCGCSDKTDELLQELEAIEEAQTEQTEETEQMEELWGEEPYYIDPIVGKYICDSDNKLWLYDDNYAIYEEDGQTYWGEYQTLDEEEWILVFEKEHSDMNLVQTGEGNLYASSGYDSEIFHKVEIGETSKLDLKDALGKDLTTYLEGNFTDEEIDCMEWTEYGYLETIDDSLMIDDDSEGRIEMIQLTNFVNNYSIHGVRLKYTLEQADKVLVNKGFYMIEVSEDNKYIYYSDGKEVVQLYIPVEWIDVISFYEYDASDFE